MTPAFFNGRDETRPLLQPQLRQQRREAVPEQQCIIIRRPGKGAAMDQGQGASTG